MTATSERFLVTGALGCIGAWTIRALVRDGATVTAFDLGTDARRLRLIMSPEDLAKVSFERGDITDFDALSDVLESRDIDHVIHLAALQVPFCRADPPLGARVNVVGTINVFEAVEAPHADHDDGPGRVHELDRRCSVPSTPTARPVASARTRRPTRSTTTASTSSRMRVAPGCTGTTMASPASASGR